MADTIDLSAALLRMGYTRPAPSNRYIAGFGDSRIFLSWSGSNGNDFLKTWGVMTWIQRYSGGSAACPVAYNGGVAGETTSDMLKRQAAFITLLKANSVNLVVVWGSTNDRTQGMDIRDSQRNLMDIVRNFQQNGIAVIVVSETPRGNGSSSYELTAAGKADHYAMHVWIETVLSQMCAVANVWDRWINVGSGSLYYALTSVVRDGIHASKIGAQLAGMVLGPIVKAYCRGLPDVPESNVVYNATTNPRGSLTTNPQVAGTSGNINANCAPTAGSQLADGWGAELSGGSIGGLATTFSKTTLADTFTYQKVSVKGITTANQCELSFYVDVPLASLANGDKVKAAGLIASEGVGIGAVGLGLLFVTSSYLQKLDGDESDPTLPYPSDNTGVLPFESPILNYTTAQNITLVRMRITLTLPPSRDVNCSIWFRKIGAVKVAY